MKVRDVMIPRAQMVVINHHAPPRQHSLLSIDSKNSRRFPVISESRDEVIGILLTKDFLQYTIEEK